MWAGSRTARIQRRTVDSGRPRSAAIRRYPVPRALASNADPMTAVVSARRGATTAGSSTWEVTLQVRQRARAGAGPALLEQRDGQRRRAPDAGSTGLLSTADRVLVTVVYLRLAEQHDEWIEGRRYLGLEVLKRARVAAVPDPAAAPEEVPTSNIPALSPQRLQKITRSPRKHASDLTWLSPAPRLGRLVRLTDHAETGWHATDTPV